MSRAQVEFQFNLIYAAIVGAVILLIVFSISMKMESRAKSSLGRDTQTYVSSLMVSNKVNPDSSYQYNIPDVEFEIQCNEFSANGITVPINSIIFSPMSVKGVISSHSRYWSLPYKSHYYTYIIGSDTRMIVIENDPRAGIIYDLIPDSADKILLPTLDYDNYEHKNLIVVAVDSVPQASVQNVLPGEMMWLNVQPDVDSGKVTYYSYDGSFAEIDTVYYFDESSMLGAIYSDPRKYRCNLEKSFDNLALVSSIQKRRIELLQEEFDYCPYQDSLSALDRMIQLSSEDVTPSIYSLIVDTANEISEYNYLYEKLSCPQIY